MLDRLWSLVLAAGAGRRLASLTGGVPKQFWRLDGGPTLLEATLSRLEPLAPPERTAVVVDRMHAPYVTARWPASRAPGRFIYQPADWGTAAGILLGLLPVLSAEPDDVVVVTPSDHGVRALDLFRVGLVRAASLTAATGRVVVFGIRPNRAYDDYGWITSGRKRTGGLREIASFVEKPPADLAHRLRESGALWNTMVVVARASSLFGLFRQHVPEVACHFDDALSLPEAERDRYLADAYVHLPVRDFSRDVLTPAQGLLTQAWPSSLGWSDLGTPERLRRWLGRHPASGMTHTAA